MSKRILVLDDNQDILEVVNEVLSYENFEVHTTSTSQNILEVAHEYHPDLVILDYLLQDGNGGDICKQLKADEKLSNIPVIIFSAYINRDVDYPAFGCEAVIPKPFDLDELVNKVNDLTKQN
ncbi:response regulator [Mucilaginibacter daejeonensis]|uniref:response regulator n=1 Tax=Mucilaginibacter daejeonensis TaxID=398049 RepID=UPI001D179FDF|nr:response regulator [Mucilaginibacter daejeonensis]UEG52229.1 response regulator [Mucilaginibacter daejeonensis]